MPLARLGVLRALALTLVIATGCGDVVNPTTDGIDAPLGVDAADPVDALDAAPDAPDADEPPPEVDVTVVVAGAGAGTVDSDPLGVACPGTCTASFPPSSEVTLTATPAAGSLFTGWTGACTGVAPTCSFVADGDRTATATFGVATYTVTITKSGGGTGTVSGSGVNCGGTCTATIAHGTVITLAATADGGAVFAGWGGACSGTGACTTTVTSDVSISAGFTTQSFSLLVARGGNGSGTVTSSPAGITCGADCDETFTSGQLVTLSAAATPGSTFTGWSGSGCSGTGACVVTIGATNVVTATFTLQTYALTVTRAGAGTGRITSTPNGISCGTDCAETFDHGTLVTLAASPAVGSTFTGWSGACTGTGSCVVGMTAARAVTATFAAIPPNLMFVTSTEQTPASLGGVAGADALCLAQAQAAGLVGPGAGQNPAFRAWLSSSTSTAPSRIGSTRGWVRPDGRPVVDAYGDLATHEVYFPPRLTATGTLVPATARIFTNTRTSGSFGQLGPSCTSPTVAGEYVGGAGTATLGGPASAVSAMLVNGETYGCNVPGRLLCVGTGRTAVVQPTATTGRVAFTTTSTFTPSGGLAGADALCTTEAGIARLPGTYKALLATTSRSAISRFDTTGAPWMRAVDQIRLAPTAELLASTTRLIALDTAPNLTADGRTRFGATGNWTGAVNLFTAGTTATTCGNWGSTAGTGTYGLGGETAIARWFGNGATPCSSTTRHLVCLQE